MPNLQSFFKFIAKALVSLLALIIIILVIAFVIKPSLWEDSKKDAHLKKLASHIEKDELTDLMNDAQNSASSYFDKVEKLNRGEKIEEIETVEKSFKDEWREGKIKLAHEIIMSEKWKKKPYNNDSNNDGIYDRADFKEFFFEQKIPIGQNFGPEYDYALIVTENEFAIYFCGEKDYAGEIFVAGTPQAKLEVKKQAPKVCANPPAPNMSIKIDINLDGSPDTPLDVTN